MSHTHRIAWCAGFFDGDGYVTIQRRKSKAKNGKVYTGHYLRIGINHVAPEPLHEIQKYLGGKVVKFTGVIGNRKPCHQWCLNCNSAAEGLKILLPYLVNKDTVAKLALEFQKTMQENKKQVSDEITNKREEFLQTIKSLNEMD